jgi:hypothetical protein
VRRVTTLAFALILALGAASCTGAADSPEPSEQALETLTPLETPEESFPTEPPLEEPLGSDEPFPTEPPLEEPLPSDEPFPSEEPASSEEPLPTEPTVVTPAPGTSIPATQCSDSTSEQDFYAKVAAGVGWDVYCPRLPAGWGLVTGHYELTSGGFLQISYRLRSGARLQLSEGAFCDQADGCVPAGSDAGAASFGDKAGTLIAGSDGSLAIVVDRGADISWVLIGQSIDEATFRSLGAGLTRVEP